METTTRMETCRARRSRPGRGRRLRARLTCWRARFASVGGRARAHLWPADVASSGGPDAKVVAGYLLFLCARLLCHRREDAAATKIQRWWRFKHWRPGRLRRWCRGYDGEQKQASPRRPARRVRADVPSFAQSAWRGLLARRIKAKAAAAACTIQRHARGKMARDAYADVQFATLIAQTHARRAIASAPTSPYATTRSGARRSTAAPSPGTRTWRCCG